MNRVMVAMSGGVDSSVAAAMLHHEGHEVIGVHMKLYDGGNSPENNKVCCSLDDVNDCRLICDKMNIPFYVMNMGEEFQKKVISYFVNSYRMGETPSPCTMCNGEIKFDLLLGMARKLGCSSLATGHYAEIKNGRLFASTSPKDQSYFLFNIKKQDLSFVRFPVSSHSKDEIRALAAKFNLITEKKRESMEICFVDKGHYSDFVKKHIDPSEDVSAILRSEDGHTLGTVDRYFEYTVGQRRGLPVTGYYVKSIDPDNKIIILSKERGLTTEIQLVRTNWHENHLDINRDLFARTRHRGVLTPVTLRDDHVEFHDQIINPAPGQVTVIYDSDGMVVGGGYIKRK